MEYMCTQDTCINNFVKRGNITSRYVMCTYNDIYTIRVTQFRI